MTMTEEEAAVAREELAAYDKAQRDAAARDKRVKFAPLIALIDSFNLEELQAQLQKIRLVFIENDSDMAYVSAFRAGLDGLLRYYNDLPADLDATSPTP